MKILQSWIIQDEQSGNYHQLYKTAFGFYRTFDKSDHHAGDIRCIPEEIARKLIEKTLANQ